MSLSEKCSSLGTQEDAHVVLLCKMVKKDIKHEANVDERNHCHDCQDVYADEKVAASGLVNCRTFSSSSSYSTPCSLVVWLADVVLFFSATWTRPVEEYGALLQCINETSPPLRTNMMLEKMEYIVVCFLIDSDRIAINRKDRRNKLQRNVKDSCCNHLTSMGVSVMV